MVRSLTNPNVVLSADAMRFMAENSDASITLNVYPGEQIGILGAPGSGKTQLLRTLAHLAPVLGGRLLWGDVDVSHKLRWLLRHHRTYVALILKNPYTFLEPWLSIQALFSKLPRQQRQSKQEIAKYLYAVGLSAGVQAERVKTLSGTERVLLAVAYALSSNPQMLLVDDVFSTLLPETWEDVLSHIQTALQPQQALLVASQYGQALKSADTVFVVWRGRVIEWGVREAVFSNPHYAYTRDLLLFQYDGLFDSYPKLEGLAQGNIQSVELATQHWAIASM